MNQYALGYKLLKGSKKVKADTIRTAFLFGLEHEMQVELFKKDKNDEIDTLEECIAASGMSQALRSSSHLFTETLDESRACRLS